jgi:hypothetical protein
MVVLLSNIKGGFYRQWRPFYGSVDKHLGYALQWFLMALRLENKREFIVSAFSLTYDKPIYTY